MPHRATCALGGDAARHSPSARPSKPLPPHGDRLGCIGKTRHGPQRLPPRIPNEGRQAFMSRTGFFPVVTSFWQGCARGFHSRATPSAPTSHHAVGASGGASHDGNRCPGPQMRGGPLWGPSDAKDTMSDNHAYMESHICASSKVREHGPVGGRAREITPRAPPRRAGPRGRGGRRRLGWGADGQGSSSASRRRGAGRPRRRALGSGGGWRWP